MHELFKKTISVFKVAKEEFEIVKDEIDKLPSKLKEFIINRICYDGCVVISELLLWKKDDMYIIDLPNYTFENNYLRFTFKDDKIKLYHLHSSTLIITSFNIMSFIIILFHVLHKKIIM